MSISINKNKFILVLPDSKYYREIGEIILGCKPI